jgi:hypothetical protein
MGILIFVPLRLRMPIFRIRDNRQETDMMRVETLTMMTLKLSMYLTNILYGRLLRILIIKLSLIRNLPGIKLEQVA